MKLWDKGFKIDQLIDSFTTGRDRELDIELAEYDVLGSMAHANMLRAIGMITEDENRLLQNELARIKEDIDDGKFEIEKGIEDVHSQVELLLTRRLGETGKKIHLGRSRNDQVLLDLRLYFRDRMDRLMSKAGQLVGLLLDSADQYREVLMPGYTHTQIAMVSSFGLWYSAYGEALIDDMDYLKAVRRLINRNPLGTAAGYGSSIPLDRHHTTRELGFEGLCINPINAQIGRGKTELVVAQGISSMALTINRLATDICQFSNENYGFLSLPKEFTTGSSIMPHKKNPDVFELIRAKSNVLLAIPGQLTTMLSNLSSGYHRDFQLQKEIIFPALDTVDVLLDLLIYCIPAMIIKPTSVYEEKYKYLFSVERVNEYVMQGFSFRDAYRMVGEQIESGEYSAPQTIDHTHIGSIGNLGLEIMKDRLREILGD